MVILHFFSGGFTSCSVMFIRGFHKHIVTTSHETPIRSMYKSLDPVDVSRRAGSESYAPWVG